MSQLNDCQYAALGTQGFVGSLNDRMLQWALANGATGGTLNDALFEMLGAQGGTGSLNDRWYMVLGTLGYAGSRNDRELAFWCDGGGTFSLIPISGWTGAENCLALVAATFAPPDGQENITYGPYDTSVLFSGGTFTSYTINGAIPIGMTFDTGTGILAGTPDRSAGGTWANISVTGHTTGGDITTNDADIFIEEEASQ